MPAAPSVSVCIPAYNAAGSLRRAIASALAQTLEDLEVVVVDDASTDSTIDVATGFDDERVRVFRQLDRMGQAANANASVSVSRGPLVKFLHADDRLHPECLRRCAEALDRDERVGLAFCRWGIELEDESDPTARAWRTAHQAPHAPFGPLQPVNDGPLMLTRWVSSELVGNWIGPPSAVMMRRTTLQRCGGFNTRVHQIVDMDLWIRALHYCHVGFVAEELATYRFGRGGVTAGVFSGADWLDSLWMLEGLARRHELWRAHPTLAQLRSRLRGRIAPNLVRAAAAGRLRGQRLAEAFAYWSFVARGDRPDPVGDVSSPPRPAPVPARA